MSDETVLVEHPDLPGRTVTVLRAQLPALTPSGWQLAPEPPPPPRRPADAAPSDDDTTEPAPKPRRTKEI